MTFFVYEPLLSLALLVLLRRWVSQPEFQRRLLKFLLPGRVDDPFELDRY